MYTHSASFNLKKKIDGNGVIGRPTHKWEDNIKRHLKEMGWKGIHWIDLGQEGDKFWAFVNSVMNLWVT